MKRLAIFFVLLVLSAAGEEVQCLANTHLSLHGRFPLLQIANYTSYYQLGLCQGQAFRNIIRGRAEHSDTLVRMQAFAKTPHGSELLQQMKELHKQRFSDYMQELQGIADGALLPLDTIFLLNLRTEYPQLKQPTEPQDSNVASQVNAGPCFLPAHQAAVRLEEQGGERRAMQELGLEVEEEGCSDVLIHFGRGRHIMTDIDHGTLWIGTPSERLGVGGEEELESWPLIAHNEDVGRDAIGRLYFVRAEQQEHTWFALCYAGELASTAFAASKESGIAFTLNALYPSPEALKLPGIGRNFISRKLIDAPTFKDGIDVLRTPAQTSSPKPGHRQKLLNVETGPGIGSASIVEVQPASWLFHANAYQRLPVPEQPGESSLHREAVAARYGDLPLKAGPKEALWILGDTSDATWPIYRNGTSPVDSGFTECTILIMAPPSRGGQQLDSDERRGRITATVFDGNPRLGNSVVSFDLSKTLLPI